MTGIAPNRHIAVAALGVTQILGYGCSFYFPAVLAMPVVRETGWPFEAVIAGVSVGLLVAGFVSPFVGRLIGQIGGRPVLVASSVLFAVGMTALALSPTLAIYFLAWAVLGVAMGAGLYDAVFAALGRLYGQGARGAIATITLFGGFSSTVCWPLSAWLEARYGWRATCLVYAALHLFVALPLQFVAPAEPQTGGKNESSTAHDAGRERALLPHPVLVFALLATIMTLTTSIGALLLAHLMTLLVARGADPTHAIALGTLFGPAQVGARVIERMFGERYHPLWTLIAAAMLMAVALALFAAGAAWLALTIVIFAAGFGISWIARGTVPLALYGARDYPATMGRLALPSLIGQALAPTAGAFLIVRAGSDATLSILAGAGAINLGLVAWLWLSSRRAR